MDTRNKAPVFDLDEDEDGDRDTMVTRKVEENTEALAGATDEADADDDNAADAAGDNVGAAVDGHRHQGRRLSRRRYSTV